MTDQMHRSIQSRTFCVPHLKGCRFAGVRLLGEERL
jgi:hypothetical protein